jgi:site-specific recombinase XerD
MTTALTSIQTNHIQPIIAMVTDAVTSEHTRRAYSRALTKFIAWHQGTGQTALNKATVNAHITALRAAGVSASSINQCLTAIRKLALGAADNGLIDHAAAQAIARVDGVRSEGKRLGNWLSKEQAQALIQAPDKRAPACAWSTSNSARGVGLSWTL